MGAIEEWGVADPAPYIDHALQVFGFERCLAEGNWFVSEGLGESYGRVFELLKEGCERAGATAAQERAVFAGNARRVYKLDAPAPGASL